MPMTPFDATVTRSPGGGIVHLVGDPDENTYPPAGERVTVFPHDDAAHAAVQNMAEYAERWHQVVALLGPDVLEDIAAGRIVRQDDAGDDVPVLGWITRDDMALLDRAVVGARWVMVQSTPNEVYTVPLQAFPPPGPRTVRVPWAKAVEQQLTAIPTDLTRPRAVMGAEVVDGLVTLTDPLGCTFVDVGDDGMVEVLDDV